MVDHNRLRSVRLEWIATQVTAAFLGFPECSRCRLPVFTVGPLHLLPVRTSSLLPLLPLPTQDLIAVPFVIELPLLGLGLGVLLTVTATSKAANLAGLFRIFRPPFPRPLAFIGASAFACCIVGHEGHLLLAQVVAFIFSYNGDFLPVS
jgi:hypothetical protein